MELRNESEKKTWRKISYNENLKMFAAVCFREQTN